MSVGVGGQISGRSRLVLVEGRRGFLDSVLRAAMGSVVTEGLSLGGGAVGLVDIFQKWGKLGPYERFYVY